MTKKEVFDTIVRTTADVCSVSPDDIKGSCKRESVVAARAIVVFWLDKAGYRTDDIMDLAGRENPEPVNKIKRRIEEYWKEWLFRTLTLEVGTRLEKIAQEIDNDFDLNIPLNRMREICRR